MKKRIKTGIFGGTFNPPHLGHLAAAKAVFELLELDRLLLIPAIFVTGAIAMGFRGQELCAIFLLFAAPTAVSSYPLAVSMDADPEIAGQMVIFTTVCCLPTFFLWVMAMSSFGLF